VWKHKQNKNIQPTCTQPLAATKTLFILHLLRKQVVTTTIGNLTTRNARATTRACQSIASRGDLTAWCQCSKELDNDLEYNVAKKKYAEV